MRATWLLNALDALVLALAAWVVVQVGQSWVGRLFYPYDLEWMEGGMLAHAWRVLHGRALYVEPGPDFIPYIYPPGYATLLGSLGAVLPLGPALGRSLSILGTLAAAALITLGVRRAGGGWPIGVASAAIFLGCYEDSGAFYDLVRPDGVALALLAGAVVTWGQRDPWAPWVSGLLLAASWSVKHHAALYGPALLAGWALAGGRRAALRFALASVVPAGGLTLLLQATTGGLFWTYLVEVPASHPVVAARIWPGTLGELALALPLTGALVAVGGARATRLDGRPNLDAARWMLAGLVAVGAAWAADWAPDPEGVKIPDRTGLLLAHAFGGLGLTAALSSLAWGAAQRRLAFQPTAGVLLVASALVIGAWMRGHHGGFLNVYIPVHWVLAFVGGHLAVGLVQRGSWGRALAGLILAGQLAWSGSGLDPRRLTPTDDDRAALDEVVAGLADCQGQVLSPYATWLPTYAGFEPRFHLIALWDVNHRQGPLVEHLTQLRAAVEAGTFGCVVEGGRGGLQHGIPENFVLSRRFTRAGGMPRTGWRVKPNALWTLRPSAADAPKEAP